MRQQSLEFVVRHLRRMANTSGAQELSDAQLLERFAADHEEEAFAELVRRHGSMVLGVSRRVLGQAQDAEDAFQATFLALARQARSVGKRGSVGGWLYRVAYRVAMKARVSDLKRKTIDREAAVAGRARRTDLKSVPPTWQELRPVLDAELDRLPEKYRLPVVLCYLEGKTYAEAARELGWSKGTVSGRLAQARHLLRRRLTRRGVVLSAGLFGTLLATSTEGAAVPAGLAAQTLKGALLLTSGQAFAGVVSARAMALLKGAVETILIGKLKAGAAVAVLLSLLAASAGLLAHRLTPVTQAQSEQKRTEAPVPPTTESARTATAKSARADQYGDPLPPRARARLGTVRLRHGDAVLALAFSPDGQTLVSAGGDQVIRFWDVKTGRQLHEFAGDRAEVSWLSFSPDGKALFTYSGGMITLWDAGMTRVIRRWPWRGRSVGAALSPDGKILAAAKSSPQRFALWQVATGKKLRELSGSSEWEMPTFSADGKTLATGDRGGVQLWEVATGGERCRLGRPPRGDLDTYVPIAFTPDGRILIVKSSLEEISMLDVASGQVIHRIPASTLSNRPAVLAPDGQTLLVRHDDGTLRLWQVATGKEIRRIGARSPVSPSEPIALSPDGKTVALGTFWSTIKLFDVETGTELLRFAGHQGTVRFAAVLGDGKAVLSTDTSGSVRLWDLATGRELRQFEVDHPPASRPMTISPDCQTLAMEWYSNRDTDQRIHLMEVATGKKVRGLRMPAGFGEVPLAFSPDGRVLAGGGGDRTIRLWETATGRVLRVWPAIRGEELPRQGTSDMGAASALAFSPDGKRLASASFDWAPEARANLNVNGVSYALYETVRLWDPATGKQQAKFRGGQALNADYPSPWCLAFSPDGNLLATANSGRRIGLWDVVTGKQVREWILPAQSVFAVAFSPDGQTLASAGGKHQTSRGRAGSDFAVRLWDVSTGKERGSLVGHTGTVRSVAFSADGKTLVSAGHDTTVVVWDIGGLK